MGDFGGSPTVPAATDPWMPDGSRYNGIAYKPFFGLEYSAGGDIRIDTPTWVRGVDGELHYVPVTNAVADPLDFTPPMADSGLGSEWRVIALAMSDDQPTEVCSTVDGLRLVAGAPAPIPLFPTLDADETWLYAWLQPPNDAGSDLHGDDWSDLNGNAEAAWGYFESGGDVTPFLYGVNYEREQRFLRRQFYWTSTAVGFEELATMVLHTTQMGTIIPMKLNNTCEQHARHMSIRASGTHEKEVATGGVVGVMVSGTYEQSIGGTVVSFVGAGVVFPFAIVGEFHADPTDTRISLCVDSLDGNNYSILSPVGYPIDNVLSVRIQK